VCPDSARPDEEVAPVKSFEIKRPSVLTPALVSVPTAVSAHPNGVGLSAVYGACGWRAQQEQSAQFIRIPVAGSSAVLPVQAPATDHGTSGLVTQASGMVKTARKGGRASGIPPRERQV
jgi:hypothetical protein